MKTVYGTGRGRDREKQRTRDQRQLVRLLVCLMLFLAVFVGKEVWPSKIAETGEQLLTVIGRNTDFRGAFAQLGRAMAKEDSVIGELGEFCVSVFAPESEETQGAVPEGENARECTQEILVQAEKEETPCIGSVVTPVDYAGEPLPEGYSAQHLYLGVADVAAPVQGVVTSDFGYRDHPTIGRYAAHGGVDIAADAGTEVAAFAAGTVESVGEDQDFGLWLRLSHANGVSSFYAHCSEICVKESEVVEAGQQVARVGSSGKSTGPHLHFEISLNGERLDPMHYISPGGTR